jgi:hypothetical protein
MSRYNWTFTLDPDQQAFVQLVDGERTIDEIVSAVANNGVFPGADRSRLVEMGRQVFQSLWQLDFFAMGLAD